MARAHVQASRMARAGLAGALAGALLAAACSGAGEASGALGAAVAVGPTRSPQIAATPAPSGPGRARLGAERAWSVQLHLHGSFSEGMGSLDSHGFEASDVGADVLWWSDHDFRITSYRHVAHLGFEAWTEPLDRGEAWAGRAIEGEGAGHGAARVKGVSREAFESLATGSAEITAERAEEGEHSLRVRARSDAPGFQAHVYGLEADRGLFKRPLASRVTVELSVWPEAGTADARPMVVAVLSEHAPHEDVPFGVYRIYYVMDDERTEPWREGPTLYVPLRLRPSQWNRLSLPVTDDAVRGFPRIHGEDNSLAQIALGVEVRRGAEGAALFDRLRIRQEISGPRAFDEQRRLIAAVGAGYPKLEQLQGVEISYGGQHLNELSVDTQLLDYDALLGGTEDARRDGRGLGERVRDRLAHSAVAAAHARGGLVSYNHMYGTGMEGAEAKRTREETLERLLATRAYGADLLEVGYRDRGGHSLDDHLWVWDRLAAQGLHLVGTGVSDSHGGDDQRWRTGKNNFLSWIYAPSPSKADLIEGLRAGRVFFGDLVRFHGTLDLTAPRGFRMGQIVLSDRAAEQLAIDVRGLEPGDAVRVVESGEVTRSLPFAGPDVVETHAVRLHAELPTVVRFDVVGSDGGAKVLSNPITFVRRAPEEGIRAARAGLDVAGVVSRRVAGFTLLGAEARTQASARWLEIRGRGADGTLELDLADFGPPETVELDGLTGTWSWTEPILRLDGLTGEGAVRIRR